jgi:hypothetical protein
MLNEKKRFSKDAESIEIKEKVRRLLSKEDLACFILITCKEPSLEGKMQVEMSYEGDSSLASYLIDNAQEFFAQETITLSES